jgi:hypothetical protein
MLPDLRHNRATWAVSDGLLPAVARALVVALPAEPFDPNFRGQRLETTYFDTPGFALRKARHRGKRYLTLRLRAYPGGAWALSAKTEDDKFRLPLDACTAEQLLARPGDAFAALLPADLLARLQELAGGDSLVAAIVVRATRYAVEDDVDRLTLDVGVSTDTGKRLPASVLEFKSNVTGTAVPSTIEALRLRPIKLSKFLWATLWR